MYSASRHARRARPPLLLIQRRAYKRKDVVSSIVKQKDIMDHPEDIERELQVVNLIERGKVGDSQSVHRPWDIMLPVTDLTLANQWIPLWPPQLAAGNNFLSRIASTCKGFVSNMRARREWLQSNTGLASFLKSAQTMYMIARSESFYHAPPYPPWATLPSEALSPELRETITPVDSPPNSIKDASGTFIPLIQFSEDVSNTRFRDPYTTIGKKCDIHLFNGKHPISPQLFQWQAVKSNWVTPTAVNTKANKKKKSKEAWIEGYRWSIMESYLKCLHAFSLGDLDSIKHLTTGEYQGQLTANLRDRYRSYLSASRFEKSKKPGWNVRTVPKEQVDYRWVFHGPYTGPGAIGNGSGCRIMSIRSRERWISVLQPPVGSTLHVQALVSFDTMQFLQVYSNGKLVGEEGPRRVREDYILEKSLYRPGPWVIRCRNWDSAGVTPQLKSETTF